MVGFGLGYLVFTPDTIPKVTNQIRQRVQLGGGDAEPAGHWGLAQPMDDLLSHEAEYRQELEKLGSLGYAGGTVTGRWGTASRFTKTTWLRTACASTRRATSPGPT